MDLPFNFAISNSGVISCNVRGKMYSFATSHPNYSAAKQAVKDKNQDEIVRLADLPKVIEDFCAIPPGDRPTVEVKDGNIYYRGKVLANSLTKRITQLIKDDFPFEPMLKFLENLMLNPSFHAVQELYNFLEHRNLPITEDGCFLAYKSVTMDYLDWHTKTIKNTVGATPSMPRNEVDDNWRQECSSGYHVGAIEYVQNFGCEPCRILIVKVNPKDVVACEAHIKSVAHANIPSLVK